MGSCRGNAATEEEAGQPARATERNAGPSPVLASPVEPSRFGANWRPGEVEMTKIAQDRINLFGGRSRALWRDSTDFSRFDKNLA
jgi:hypothetical protein